MLHFVTSYMKQNNSHKQTLKSAQNGLEISFKGLNNSRVLSGFRSKGSLEPEVPKSWEFILLYIGPLPVPRMHLLKNSTSFSLFLYI